MLAFIVPDVGNDDALAVVQEIVIAHVGSDIELCPGLDRLVEQETAGSATQGNTAHHAVAVAAVTHGAHFKCLLDTFQYLSRRHRINVTDDAAACSGSCLAAIGCHIVHIEKIHMGHPYLVGHAERHSA